MSFNNVVYAANEQAPKSKSRMTLEVQTEFYATIDLGGQLGRGG